MRLACSRSAEGLSLRSSSLRLLSLVCNLHCPVESFPLQEANCRFCRQDGSLSLCAYKSCGLLSLPSSSVKWKELGWSSLSFFFLFICQRTSSFCRDFVVQAWGEPQREANPGAIRKVQSSVDKQKFWVQIPHRAKQDAGCCEQERGVDAVSWRTQNIYFRRVCTVETNSMHASSLLFKHFPLYFFVLAPSFLICFALRFFHSIC